MVLIVLTAGTAGTASAEISGKSRQVSIKFPAFSLSPGERISGVTLTSSAGRIHTGCRPNRWTCEERGNTMHCYTLHPTYAIAISGMLPEFIIRDTSSSGRPFSLQATVEFLDNDGKEYSREISESDLIVK
jgi:hypothetical protein